MHKHLIIIVLVILLLSGTYYVGNRDLNQHKTMTVTSGKSSDSIQPPAFSKNQFSLSDPKSLWVVVDKRRPLNPKTYVPANLVIPNIPLRSNITSTEEYVRSDMATALETMVADAKSDGVNLNLQSGYRSYDFQVTLYNSYVAQQGQSQADQESARPGYSEHQTGLAADLGGTSDPACNVAQCFATTVEGKWLATNAYRYGFIIRYPDGQEQVTGYEYEPWHVRFVGVALATEMYRDNTPTLETFFGLAAAPSYK